MRWTAFQFTGWVLWICALPLTLLAQAAPPLSLRSGNAFLSSDLLAMQNDATRNPTQLWLEQGRKLWGSLVNNSRSLMGKIQPLLGAKHASDLALLRDALSPVPYALRDHVRDDARAEDLPALGNLDRRALTSAQNRPLYLHSLLARHLQELRSDGVLTDEHLLYLNDELFSLIDITGACERINNSPIPFS